MSATTSSSAAAPPAAGSGEAFLLALFTETPLHPGTGQSTGIIDLPIQRERHTQFPMIPATSVKGCLRELAEHRWRGPESAAVTTLFSPAVQQGGDLHAGALGFTDARLLAFPVRSLDSVFLWVTYPLALGRLARDLRLAGQDAAGTQAAAPEPNRAVVGPGLPGTIVLEDLSFTAQPRPDWPAVAGRLAGYLPEGETHRTYREKFGQHLVLLRDEDFTDLVEHATQVTARIKLNERKTTSGDGGNLWYEETIPPDTLFHLLVRPEPPRSPSGPVQGRVGVRSRLLELVSGNPFFLQLVSGNPFFLQLGGNETVGQGWCAVRTLGA